MRISVVGKPSNAERNTLMKNKFRIISQFGVVIALLSFTGMAKAQMGGGQPAATKTSPGEPDPRDRVGPHTFDPRTTTTPAAALSASDKTFMANAAKGGTMEVEWGKWASQKAQNADVKKFGNQMVTDHSRAGNELTALASKKGVKLPASKVSGKWTSDKDYMDMMVKDHEKDLAEFQTEAKNGSDPDLKKWAGDTAKMIKRHLDLAKKTQAKLK
jgi:putative membrane protein